MFMKNIMIKSKQITEALQAENLNVVDAMTIIMATVESLKRINDDEKAMDDEIQAGIVFAKKLVGNPEAEFSRKHRVRRPPRKIDDNPNTQAELSIFQFYRKEFKKVLDTQVDEFGDNLTHKNVFENDHDRCTFRIADVVVLREGFNRCYKYRYNF